MKKTIALLLVAVMVFALCAACGSKTEEPAAAPAAEAAPAAAPEAAAPEAAAPDAAAPAPEAAAPAAAEGDDFQEWLAYLAEYAAAGAPTEDEGNAVKASIMACTSEEEVDAIPQMTVLFGDVGVLRFADWVAAGKPAADTANMGSPTGEPSGEPTEEPAA